jgi:hypothetical protein
MKTLLAIAAALCLFASTAQAQPNRRPPVVVVQPVLVPGPAYPFGRPFVAPPVVLPRPYVQPFLYPYPPVAFGFSETFRFRYNQFGFQYQYQFGRFGW